MLCEKMALPIAKDTKKPKLPVNMLGVDFIDLGMPR